ncbi:hypothetical protein OPQ81_011621 [Rhizoctonia solani]|nr:hypothetical protein OPQ81_011621 [Rhizoctonia solani]
MSRDEQTFEGSVISEIGRATSAAIILSHSRYLTNDSGVSSLEHLPIPQQFYILLFLVEPVILGSVQSCVHLFKNSVSYIPEELHDVAAL